MTALAAAVLLAVAVRAEPQVTIDILGRSAPAEALVESRGRSVSLAARGDALLADGLASAQPLALPAASWRVRIGGEPGRSYVGALEIRAQGSALRLALAVPLEEYVARVVASETPPGTPLEALRAQAVVARSFAVAARDRHPGGRLCDLAHCQVLRGHGIAPEHLAAAAAAARATAGVVLRLRSGAVAEAVFHASCGGHTADPVEVFGGAATGAAAVPDPGCGGPPWSASVPADVFLRVARERFAVSGAEAARPRSASDVLLVRGAGGWIVQVASRDGGRTGGDGFARALDGALGWNQVRSSRFRIEAVDSRAVHLAGSGLGHGVGLCQAGAARRALAGEDHVAILAHYFPQATPAR